MSEFAGSCSVDDRQICFEILRFEIHSLKDLIVFPSPIDWNWNLIVSLKLIFEIVGREDDRLASLHQEAQDSRLRSFKGFIDWMRWWTSALRKEDIAIKAKAAAIFTFSILSLLLLFSSFVSALSALQWHYPRYLSAQAAKCSSVKWLWNIALLLVRYAFVR